MLVLFLSCLDHVQGYTCVLSSHRQHSHCMLVMCLSRVCHTCVMCYTTYLSWDTRYACHVLTTCLSWDTRYACHVLRRLHALQRKVWNQFMTTIPAASGPFAATICCTIGRTPPHTCWSLLRCCCWLWLSTQASTGLSMTPTTCRLYCQ